MGGIMKYFIFYTSILMISFSAFSAKEEPKAEQAEQAEQAEPAEQAKQQQKPQDLDSVFLEETHIGQAVMKGDREKYQKALTELKKVFGVNINTLLNKKTSDGQTLDILMLTPQKNKEYFAIELIHLLTLKVLSNIPETVNNLYIIKETDLQPLLEKAQSVNNVFALQMLKDFNKLIEEMTRYHIKKIESELKIVNNRATEEKVERLKLTKEAINWAQSSKYNLSMGFSGLLRLIVGSVMVFGTTGYVWAVDPFLLDRWAEIVATLSKGALTNKSAYYSLLTAFGVGGAFAIGSGYDRCSKAFQKKKALDNIKQQMQSLSKRDTRAVFEM